MWFFGVLRSHLSSRVKLFGVLAISAVCEVRDVREVLVVMAHWLENATEEHHNRRLLESFIGPLPSRHREEREGDNAVATTEKKVHIHDVPEVCDIPEAMASTDDTAATSTKGSRALPEVRDVLEGRDPLKREVRITWRPLLQRVCDGDLVTTGHDFPRDVTLSVWVPADFDRLPMASGSKIIQAYFANHLGLPLRDVLLDKEFYRVWEQDIPHLMASGHWHFCQRIPGTAGTCSKAPAASSTDPWHADSSHADDPWNAGDPWLADP